MIKRIHAQQAALCCLLGLFCLTTLSQEKGHNAGILYGENFAFGFTAPIGWVLDNQSGVSQGLDAVFYPVGHTWTGSQVIAYARARDITAKIKTAADVVRDTLQEFRHDNNPHCKAVKMAPIPIGKERAAQVYYYTGDKYGNYEAAAYIVEAKTINFFILSSKQKPLFNKSIPAFQSLVKSYLYLGDSPLAVQKKDH